MPLRAVSGLTSIHAFELDGSAWTRLKESYKVDCLRMPCCDQAAIPKTSKLGSFFFAHARRGDCTTAPESAEHIYLKTLVASAASSAGWSVVTEWRSEPIDGQICIADVYCTKGSARVALEVQLAYQSPPQLLARHTAYTRREVRAAWLTSGARFKEGYITPRKAVPFFRLSPFVAGAEPTVIPFDVSVTEFVVALLSKQLSWRVTPVIYAIYYVDDTCWRCRRGVRQLYGIGQGVFAEFAKTAPNMSEVLRDLRRTIPNEELIKHGLNTVGRNERIKSNAPGFPYCNVCIHCGAPQGNGPVMKKLANPRSHETVIEIRGESSGAWHFEKADHATDIQEDGSISRSFG